MSRTKLTYEDVFEQPPIASYARVDGTFPSSSVRVSGTIEAGDVGRKFGCSEVMTGAGAKTCKFVSNGDVISRRNVGAGKMFQFTIQEEHVGDFYFDYWQQDANSGKPFVYILETYAM